MAAQTNTDSIPCPVCDYPIPMPNHVGQEVVCAYCGSIHKAIAVEIPNTLFVGVIAFIVGVIVGPAVIAATQSGSEAMARKARAALSR